MIDLVNHLAVRKALLNVWVVVSIFWPLKLIAIFLNELGHDALNQLFGTNCPLK